MSEEPDIVNEMRREEKLGRLQDSVQISSDEVEIEEKSSENAPGDSISIFKEDVKRMKEKDFTIIGEVKKEKRYSGVSVIGDISWGTHLCQFYTTKEDLLDILVPYFKAGLENNEFCMWVTSEPLSVDEAKSALGKVVQNLEFYMKKGQIEILNYDQWYTKSSKFDGEKVLAGWVEKEKQALKNGFDGLRLTGNTSWLEKQDWKAFKEYEAKVNRVIGTYHMLAICSYFFEKCGSSELLDDISNHQFALIRRNGTWEIIERSERKRMEEEILFDEGKFRRAIDSSPDNITISDLNGYIVDCNQATVDMHGFSKKEDIIGKNALELIAPKDREKAMENLKKTLELGSVKNVEYTFLKKDGSEFPAELSACVVRDSRGNPLSFIGVMKDISERKKAAQELQQSEEKYRTLLETTDTGFCILDLHGNILDANPEYVRLSGHSTLEEIKGRSIIEWTAVCDLQRNAEEVKKCIQQGFVRSLEIDYVDKHGKTTPIEINATIIQTGESQRILTLCRDITERKKAEGALKESQEKYKRLFDSSPELIIENDEEGNILAVNPAMAKNLGVPAEKLIGKNVFDILPREMAEERAKIARKALEEMKNRECDDERAGRYFQNIYVPIINPDGKKTIQLIVRDVTAQKKAEATLKESEEKFRKLFDDAPAGIVLVDKNGIIKEANNSLLQLLSIQKEEFIGKNFVQLAPAFGLDVKENITDFSNRLAEKPPKREITYLNKNNSKTTINVQSSEIKNGDEILGVLYCIEDITELKRTEAELKKTESIRESAQRLHTVIDSAEEGITLSDAEGHFEIFNAKMNEITGYTREEANTSTDFTTILYLDPHERKKALENNTETVKKGISRNFETIIQSKDGTKKTLLVSTSMIQIDNRNMFLSVYHDITERKKVQKALEVSEVWYRRLFESAQDGILLLDFDTGMITDVNPFLVELLGYSKDDFLKKCIWEIGVFKDVIPSKDHFLELQTKRYIRYGDLPLETKGGKKRDVEFISNVYLVDGTKTIQCNIRDITERKLTEKALEVSELRYRRLFESAQDGILLLDFDTGKITDVNPFLIDLLGYSKTDLLEKHLWEINAFKDIIKSKDNFLELQTKEYIRYEDLPLETKDGKKIDAEFVSNVYHVDGTKTIQCNIRDITERKQTQVKLKAADEKIIEIFQKIQNQKIELERKSRNLEETNKHLDGFAYSVSHDLRAPLRSVSGFSQVLLDEYKDKTDDQMKHYLERIFIGTKKMGDLIDALLHFSRTTRADLQYETVDVEKIITNIIKDQTAAHPERTIDFVVQPIPRVEADGKMVEVIFVNLIGNAVKFTSKRKEAHIEIGSRQDNDERQFFVKDNGAGFDMKFKDKLFGAFQRLHSENEFEGNGIGLTTVARLVTKHGGRVWAEGEVDKGATFYFTIPLKRSNL